MPVPRPTFPPGYGRRVALAAESVNCTTGTSREHAKQRRLGLPPSIISREDAAEKHDVKPSDVKDGRRILHHAPDLFAALKAGTVEWQAACRAFKKGRPAIRSPGPTPPLPVKRSLVDPLTGQNFESLVFQVNKISVVADILAPADLVAMDRQRLRSQFVRSLPKVLSFLTELQRLLDHDPG